MKSFVLGADFGDKVCSGCKNFVNRFIPGNNFLMMRFVPDDHLWVVLSDSDINIEIFGMEKNMKYH